MKQRTGIVLAIIVLILYGVASCSDSAPAKPYSQEWLEEEHKKGNFTGYDNAEDLRDYIIEINKIGK